MNGSILCSFLVKIQTEFDFKAFSWRWVLLNYSHHLYNKLNLNDSKPCSLLLRIQTQHWNGSNLRYVLIQVQIQFVKMFRSPKLSLNASIYQKYILCRTKRIKLNYATFIWWYLVMWWTKERTNEQNTHLFGQKSKCLSKHIVIPNSV